MYNEIILLKKKDFIKILIIISTGLFYGFLAYITEARACGDAITFLNTDSYLKFNEGRSEFLFITVNLLLKNILIRTDEMNFFNIFIYTTYFFFISNFLFYLFLRFQRISRSTSLSLICLSGFSYSVFIGSCQYSRQFITAIIGFLLIFSLSKDKLNKKDYFLNLIMLSIMFLTHSGVTITFGFSFLLIYLIKKIFALISNYRINIIRSTFILVFAIFLIVLAYFLAGSYLYPVFTYLSYGYIESGNMIFDDLKIGLLSFFIYIFSFLTIYKWSSLICKAIPNFKNKKQINKLILNLILISFTIFTIGLFIFPYIYRAMALKSIWLLLSLAFVYEFEKENNYLIKQKDMKIIFQYKNLAIISNLILISIEWQNLLDYL